MHAVKVNVSFISSDIQHVPMLYGFQNEIM